MDVQLSLEINSMRVFRGEPLDLGETVDFDGDGVPNDGYASANERIRDFAAIGAVVIQRFTRRDTERHA